MSARARREKRLLSRAFGINATDRFLAGVDDGRDKRRVTHPDKLTSATDRRFRRNLNIREGFMEHSQRRASKKLSEPLPRIAKR